jgi:hypothetical protein
LGVTGEAKERSDNEWQVSPLQMGSGLDPYGITKIVLEFDTGEEEVLLPRIRDEFGSYELNQVSTYLEALSHDLAQRGE